MYIGIIGAGVSGLATAKVFKERGHKVIILEKSVNLGGIWDTSYTGASLQSKKWIYEYSSFPIPKEYHDHTTAPQMVQYLRSFADRFEIYCDIRFQRKVFSVTKDVEKKVWTVCCCYGEKEEIYEFDYLIVCTGCYGNPNRPTFKNQEFFKGEVYHSSELKTLSQLAEKKVLVLGYGKSGYDVAEFAAIEKAKANQKSNPVVFVFRKPHWMIPILRFGSFNLLYSLLFVNMLGFWGSSPSSVWDQFWEKLREIVALIFFRLLELLLIYRFELWRPERKIFWPSHKIEQDMTCGAFNNTQSLFPLMEKNLLQLEMSCISEFSKNGKSVILSNGKEYPVDIVVLATGGSLEISFLGEICNLRSDGVQLYRHIIDPTQENLAFNGLNESFLFGLNVEISALWLAYVVEGKIKLPPKEEMEASIRREQLWKIKHEVGNSYSGTKRANCIGMRHIAYIESLLDDIPINNRPKHTLFSSIQPSQYSSIWKK